MIALMFVAVDLEPEICNIHIGSMMFQWATPAKLTWNAKVGGGFKYFLCSSLLGEMIQFDYSNISDGLKPPTSGGF